MVITLFKAFASKFDNTEKINCRLYLPKLRSKSRFFPYPKNKRHLNNKLKWMITHCFFDTSTPNNDRKSDLNFTTFKLKEGFL